MEMPVPAAFSDFFTDKDSRDYAGDYWYETEIFIPAEWRDMDISLRFASTAHRATVYLNGTELGFHEGGFLPFCVAVNKAAFFDKANKLSVKCNNELREDRLPVGITTVTPDNRKISKAYFDFFNYSGLLRPVKLVAVPKEHIVDFSVSHTLIQKDAEVEYAVVTTGDNPVGVAVY